MFGPANLMLYLHVPDLGLHYNLVKNTFVFLVEPSLYDFHFFGFFQVFVELFIASFVHYLQEFHLEAFLCMTGVLHLLVSRCWAKFRVRWMFDVTQ